MTIIAESSAFVQYFRCVKLITANCDMVLIWTESQRQDWAALSHSDVIFLICLEFAYVGYTMYFYYAHQFTKQCHRRLQLRCSLGRMHSIQCNLFRPYGHCECPKPYRRRLLSPIRLPAYPPHKRQAVPVVTSGMKHPPPSQNGQSAPSSSPTWHYHFHKCCLTLFCS